MKTARDARHHVVDRTCVQSSDAALAQEPEPSVGPPNSVRHRIDDVAEFTVAGLCRLLRIFAGPKARINAAYFEHAAPEHRHEYRRVFDGAERFGQEFTGIEFPREFLDTSQLHQHPRLYLLLREEAHRALDTLAQA